MKRKTIIIIISSVVIVCLGVFIYFNNNYTEKGIEKYNELINTNSNLMNFSLEEIGLYDDIEFQSTKTGDFLFSSYGSLIVASYNDIEFEKQLMVLDNLKYQTEPIFFDESKYALPETEFQIGDWRFKVLESKSPNYFIPKDIDIIAVNNSMYEIAYLTFYDQDVDYLCKESEKDGYMEYFVKKYFKYDFE